MGAGAAFAEGDDDGAFGVRLSDPTQPLEQATLPRASFYSTLRELRMCEAP